MGKQLRKIRSGMGDRNHLLAQRPEREYATEQFNARWRLEGREQHTEQVFTGVPVDYGYYYEGQRSDMSNEAPYYVDINAHPKRCFPYSVEQHKKLPIERLWETKAEFRATVIKRTLEYALKWQGEKEVEAPIKYRIGWSAAGFEDPLSLFVNSPETRIAGAGNSSASYTFQGQSLVDKANQDYMTGTIANPAAIPDTTTDIEMTIDMRPIPSGSEYAEFTRWYWNNGAFQRFPTNVFTREIDGVKASRDDDAIGFIVKAKKNGNKLSGFLFLWEAHERVITGRRLKVLDGFNIAGSSIRDPGSGLKDEKWAYYDTQASSADAYVGGVAEGLSTSNASNKARFKDFTENRGWKANHMHVYEIKDNILKPYGSYATTSGNKPGWKFNEWHSVKISVKGSKVDFSAKIPGVTGGLFTNFFSFDTGVAEGTIGICNLSQAVEYKNATIKTEAGLSGYVPADGYDEYTGPDKQLSPNASDYVKKSVEDAAKEAGVNDITVKTIWSEVVSDSGEVTVKSLTGPIDIKVGKMKEAMEGRIPKEGWFEWDGFEGGVYKKSKVHAANVEEFVKESIKEDYEGQIPEGFTLTNFEGEVKDPKAGHVTTAFDFVAVSSNAPDAGKEYIETYYKCGNQIVTPDNYDESTCVTAFEDITALFLSEDSEFFNRRPDWDTDSFVRLYELTKPVPPVNDPNAGREVIETNPNTDCVIYAPEPEKDDDFEECTIDFYFDGQSLCMWSCEFPVEIDIKHFEACVFAYQGMQKFFPLEEFEPNQWTFYKIFPLLSAIKTDLDLFAVSGEQRFDEVAIGSWIEVTTEEYYEVRFPEQVPNVGMANSDEMIDFPLPSFPEHYVDPFYERPAIEEGYKEIHYLMDVWENKEDIAIRWVTDKTPLNGVYEVNPEKPTWDGLLEYSKWHVNVPANPTAVIGEPGMKLLIATEARNSEIQGRHFIQVQCLERETIRQWNSGMMKGHVIVNGLEPLLGPHKGKNDIKGIRLDEIYFPEDVIPESIKGPFVIINNNCVQWKIEADKTLTLTSNCKGAYNWDTDWTSDWVHENNPISLTYGTPDTTGKHVYDIERFENTPKADLTKLVIDRVIVESNNPFVNLYVNALTDEQKLLIKQSLKSGKVAIPVFGYFKPSYPYPWSPMVHSGYYYVEEQEHYLFAEKQTDVISNHTETLSERPRQGAPILARNRNGKMLTKTAGFNMQDLMQAHTIEQRLIGTGHAKYYLRHQHPDPASLQVLVNDRPLADEEYVFAEEDNSIQFMHALHETDSITFFYAIQESFYVDLYEALYDPSADITVHFHESNAAADLYGGELIYEKSKLTPFYYGSEVRGNPLHQNFHTGFLYIDEDVERIPTNLQVFASQQYVDVENGEKILVTARVTDQYDNPIEKVPIDFYENGVKVTTLESNLSGEAYLRIVPKKNDEYVTRLGVNTETLFAATQVNNTKPYVTKRYHIEMTASSHRLMAGNPAVQSTITLTLRNDLWQPVTNKSIKVSIVDTKGQTLTSNVKTNSSGVATFQLSAKNEVRGELFVKAEYNMESELAMNALYIQVTGE